MSNETFRRKLDPREVRLFLFADGVNEEIGPRQRELHAVRETLNGRKIPACAIGEAYLGGDYNYWSFPLLDFLIARAPCCFHCMETLIEENLIVDTRAPA